MMYVKALAADTWHTAPQQPIAEVVLEKTLVKSLESGVWSVNNQAVLVFPGLVVSFVSKLNANFFLEQPSRAERVVVEAGEIVAFYEDADALHFVAQGLAEPVSEDDVKQLAESKATHAKAANVLNITTPAKAGKRAGSHQ
jgi:hypothetical protein